MEIIDIGVNLSHDSFDRDRDEVIAAARKSGVGAMVVTGTNEEGSRAALALTTQYPDLYATAGVHPHYAKDYSPETDTALRELLKNDRVVAVGECGLDFFRNFSPPEAQESALEKQLAIAADIAMPVFLHQRDAHQRLLDILKKYRDKLPRAVVHCFTGSMAEVKDCLDMDLHIGITGWICDERRGLHLKEVVREIPRNRLMIETDAPYLIPRNIHPKPKSNRNEPKYLLNVLNAVADALSIKPEELASTTTQTAKDFFQLG